MISPSLIQQIKGRWREFRREPSAIIFVIMMPLIWMVILGLSFSGEHKFRANIGLLLGTDVESSIVKAVFQKDAKINIVDGDQVSLVKKLKQGKINLIVKLEKNLVTYKYDPNNQNADHARWYLSSIVNNINMQAQQSIIAQKQSYINVPGTRYIDFLIPSLIAFSIMTSSLFGTGMTIVSNRKECILKLYTTTPMKIYEYIVSHVIGRGFVLVVELLVILLVGYLLFSFATVGNLFAFVVFAVLGAATFTAIAILLGSRVSNTGSMNHMINLFTIPMMLLSGIWFSRTNFPHWLYEITNYLPLSLLVDGLRSIALEGDSIFNLGFNITFLVAYIFVASILAKRMFKWY